MEDWSTVRVFGAAPAGARVRLRPSAYALLADGDGRVALVRAPDGVYLPGGGLEPAETPEEALTREGLEECGLLLRPGARVCRAIQFAPREAGDGWNEKRCHFFGATIMSAHPERLLPGHETLWVPPGRAAEHLEHPSQAWAIDTWLRTR